MQEQRCRRWSLPQSPWPPIPSWSLAYLQPGPSFGPVRRISGSAQQAWLTATSRFPDSEQAHLGLGDSYLAEGDKDHALAEYLRVTEINPQHAVAYNNLGLIYLDRSDLGAAGKYFHLALNADPKLVAALNNLGVIYQKQGKLDQARQMYEQALAVDPAYEPARQNLDALSPAPPVAPTPVLG